MRECTNLSGTELNLRGCRKCWLACIEYGHGLISPNGWSAVITIQFCSSTKQFHSREIRACLALIAAGASSLAGTLRLSTSVDLKMRARRRRSRIRKLASCRFAATFAFRWAETSTASLPPTTISTAARMVGELFSFFPPSARSQRAMRCAFTGAFGA